MKKLFVTALAAVMGVTGLGIGATASAAPAVPMMQVETRSNVIQVQDVDDPFIRRHHRRFNGPRYAPRSEFRRPGPRFAPRSGFYTPAPRYAPRQGFYVQSGNGWYNGHRGYRNYRQGYRRHGDWWFPAGAFIAGAIIGGALADPGPTYYEPRPVYRRVYRSNSYSNAHVRWCYNRYRSYDVRSNTFQPYNGPRQQCWSPYN